MEPQHIILDLDNCISDDAWRIPMIKWDQTGDERYDTYHAMHVGDRVGNKHLFADPDATYHIITGRPTIHRRTTMLWLEACCGIHPRNLFMRAIGTKQKTVDIKRHAAKLLISKLRINDTSSIVAYDDRQDIVDMYRSLGLTAGRHWIHEEDAYEQR